MNGNRQVFAAPDRTHKKQVNFNFQIWANFLAFKMIFSAIFSQNLSRIHCIGTWQCLKKKSHEVTLIGHGVKYHLANIFSFRSICFCCNRLWSSLSRSDSSPDDQFRIGGVTTVGGAGSKTATPKIVVKQELVRNHLVNYFCIVPHRQHAHHCSIFPSNQIIIKYWFCSLHRIIS